MSTFCPDVEVVTHCWSGDDVPVYHKLLWLQLLSIIERPDDGLRVSVIVFHDPGDDRTTAVIEDATRRVDHHRTRVWVCPYPLSKANLFRRAIGRNSAARTTDAYAVWFADCDYLLPGRALRDAFDQMSRSSKDLIWPAQYEICKDHATGDALMNDPSRALQFNVEDYAPRRERRAIGGVQIVRGTYCRQNGYLHKTKWVEPVPDAEHFLSCKCDVPFRRAVGGAESRPIHDVYRIRHSRAGRDRGTVDHAAKSG